MINVVRQGESFNFEFDRDGQSIAGWICEIILKQFPGDTAILTRTITPDSGKWKGFLTETETSALNIGPHILIGKLSNATTNEEDQQLISVNIAKTWDL